MAYIAMSPPDFWNVSNDVYPTSRGFSTDIMLVQSLLIAYFLSPVGVRADLKAKAVAIFRSSPKRFDDGFYGPKTREVLRLFEEDMSAPFKDGIVRRVPLSNLGGGGPDTKLKRLNFQWNMTMLSDTLGTTKEESGRRALPAPLFLELYGS